LSLADVFYHLRLYWDYSILARLILYSIGAYGVFSILIVGFEFGRERLARQHQKECGHQLVACWVACFLLVLTLIALWRIFDRIPR